MKLDVVRTLGSRDVCESGLSGRTRHTGNLLGDGMGVGGHEADALDRTDVEGHVTGPAITLAGVLKDKSLGGVTETGRIDRTVVSSVEPGVTADVGHAPVRDGHAVDGLVEYTLSGEAHRERGRE